MEKRELTPNLAKAVIKVMKAVKGIEKSMTIGSGTNSYQGVPDKEVKKIIGEAMEEAGLCILPIGVEAKTQVDRWEETNSYGTKMKQSVFTEAVTRYLLLHESGESEVLEGYGHGVDSQDKSAGKSTTYALKYCLLYTFLVPTGKIDDADNTHSDAIETPQPKVTPPAASIDYKKTLTDCQDLNQLKNAFTALPKEQKELLTTVKDDMKEILEQVQKIGEIKTMLALEAYIEGFNNSHLKDNAKLKALLEKRKLELKG